MTRVGRKKAAGWKARVVGLGNEVQLRRRRCPLRSRLPEKDKISIGLERSFQGVSGVRFICFHLFPSLVDNVASGNCFD